MLGVKGSVDASFSFQAFCPPFHVSVITNDKFSFNFSVNSSSKCVLCAHCVLSIALESANTKETKQRNLRAGGAHVTLPRVWGDTRK